MAVSNICHAPPYTLELYGILSNLTHRIYIDCFFRWLAQPLVATVPRLDTPRAIDLQGAPEKALSSAGFFFLGGGCHVGSVSRSERWWRAVRAVTFEDFLVLIRQAAYVQATWYEKIPCHSTMYQLYICIIDTVYTNVMIYKHTYMFKWLQV